MFEILIHFPREIRLGISNLMRAFFSVFWSLFLRATRRERVVSCLPFRWGLAGGLGCWHGRQLVVVCDYYTITTDDNYYFWLLLSLSLLPGFPLLSEGMFAPSTFVCN